MATVLSSIVQAAVVLGVMWCLLYDTVGRQMANFLCTFSALTLTLSLSADALIGAVANMERYSTTVVAVPLSGFALLRLGVWLDRRYAWKILSFPEE